MLSTRLKFPCNKRGDANEGRGRKTRIDKQEHLKRGLQMWPQPSGLPRSAVRIPGDL